MSEQESHQYHTYTIKGIRHQLDGDMERWAAWVYVNGNRLFRFVIKISQEYILSLPGDVNGQQFVEQQGLLRLHARLDFGEFVPDPDKVHQHQILTTGETVDPPFHRYSSALFANLNEKLTFYI